MFIEAKKLIGLPLAALENQVKIGDIYQIIIDPQDGHILGFLISTGWAGGLFTAKKTVSFSDIREWDPNGLVTNSAENVVPVEEVVRVREIVDQKIDFFGLKAKTESGKNLGFVEDFLIETDTGSVTKYYLKDMMLKSRVFPSEKVVKIENKTIIFSDDSSEVPSEGAPATA